MTPTTRYRPEIDGLRAVAVLPVMLFHAGLAAFAGGFVGVDVFFVISGYLITGIIHDEIRAGSFSIVRFYERRVRRLWPALAVVTLACLPFAWLWMMPQALERFATSLIAVNAFWSNVLFFTESGYFSAEAELKPMLHTWSLAVEEQFYLFFPLLLLLLRRLRERVLLAVLALLAATSFGLSEWASIAHPSANFYLLPMRAWELGVGAIVAIVTRRALPMPARWAGLAASLGLLMILGAMALYDQGTPFPGVAALAPVVGTALVIAAARPTNLVGRLLAWKPLVGIGLVSYSAYLWHQPLYAFARIRLLGDVSPATYLALAALALVLAYVTWRLVEQPLRDPARWSRRRVFAAAAAVSVAGLAIGVAGRSSGGFPHRIAPDAVAIEAWTRERDSKFMTCGFGPGEPFDPDKACGHGTANATIAVWGDSHADALTAGLAEVAGRESVGVVQYTSQSCMPALGYEWRYENWNCLAQTRAIYDAILANPRLETVILAGRWSFFFEGTRFDNRQGGIEPGVANTAVIQAHPDLVPGSAEHKHQLGQLVKRTVDGLVAAGRRVVLVHAVPEVGWEVPSHLARELHYGIGAEEQLSTSRDVFLARAGDALTHLGRASSARGVISVRPDLVFCDSDVPNRCIAEREGQPLFFDDDHLNSVGARMVADLIFDRLKAGGRPSRGP